MDKADLETYQVQLSQVELALAADPGSTELTSLRDELNELIGLTQAALAQHAASPASAKGESSRKGGGGGGGGAAATAAATRAWSAGDECLAKYSGDGQWYPARITSVGGSPENRVFSVTFKGYNSTELLNAAQLKALPPSHSNHNHSHGYLAAGAGGPGGGAGGAGAGGKRKLTKVEEEEREKKKKKNEKKLEVKAAKAKEQTEKQQSWQKFAKKSERKGIHIAGVSGTSIFKTPDNPLGRVGVTGSGKGMTEVAPRIKHKFDSKDDE